MKLLKGKRLRPDLPEVAQPAVRRVHSSAGRPASAGAVAQRLGERGSPFGGSVIAPGEMRPAPAEVRASCQDAGVMVVSGPS